MFKNFKRLAIFAIVGLQIAGCSSKTTIPESAPTKEAEIIESAQPQEEGLRTIQYLNQSYTVPIKPERILFLNAFESMEDAVLLGYKPYASSAIGDEDEPFPGFFSKVMDQTIPLLSQSDESLEYVLDLAPDIILSTDMETSAVLEQLEKVAPTIPTSHMGPDWQHNLLLLADLIGKTELAEQKMAEYEQNKQELASRLPTLQDKSILAVKVRGGQMMVYPATVFLNDVLYGEIGLPIPELIAKTSEQTVITLEGLFAVNPDYLFVQFDLFENNQDEQLLNQLLDSPIWKGLKAVQNEQAFVNAVDPLIMGGGTAYGRMAIIEAMTEKLR